MIEEISNFLHSFKNRIIEADEISKKYGIKIKDFAKKIEDGGLDKDVEENFLTILGYSYRLDDVKQRLFFTFQEAVYAIDLDILMGNEESKKLNSIVYILVLNNILNEYDLKEVDKSLKEKAIETYRVIENRKAKENQKYHMYQS